MRIVLKALLAIVGLVCALYTVMAVFSMVKTAQTANLSSADGSGDLLGSLFPVLLGLAGGIVCFRYVFKKQKAAWFAFEIVSWTWGDWPIRDDLIDVNQVDAKMDAVAFTHNLPPAVIEMQQLDDFAGL
jgi:hypothetical protein